MARQAFVPGAVWHGAQTLVDASPACEDAYPHAVDYSLQLVSLADSASSNATVQNAVFVLSGNAWDMLSGNVTGYCVFQQLMSGAVDRVKRTVSLTDVMQDNSGGEKRQRVCLFVCIC